ncbi:MAG: cupin domain-containing protein [Pseudomonadales bacterium]|nr:cupin domain-containing protein [Pseudomonadales bacterium]NIX07964.1 cupin domain-containing protein [Pseudomonadales bacterium]
MSTNAWQVFHVDDLKSKLKGDAVEYSEFLRVPSVSCGLYHLTAGSRDMQTPHDEDEMYFVLEGRAQLKIGDETHEVRPGSVLYVQATEAHSFFEIAEDMTLLVFFPSTI